MTFFLTVTRGADEGKTFRVESGECTIGRAPTSTIVLTDESVAWEHAVLRVESGRLFVQNLSAGGTRLRGRRITDEARLGSQDELELSDECAVRVQQRLGQVMPRIRATPAVIAVVAAAIILVGGIAYLLLRPEPSTRLVLAPPTLEHYHRAYTRIGERLQEWATEGRFPEEALELYRDAWRHEVASNPEAAIARWERLRSLLLTIPMPDRLSADDDVVIAQAAGPDSTTLGVIMDWYPDVDSNDRRWTTDEKYADGLWWFVRRRSELLRDEMEEQ